MAINSLDDVIVASANGHSHRTLWNKATGLAAYTAGRWYDTSFLYGSPTSETFPGTTLNATLFSATTNPGWMNIGNNVAPYEKCLVNFEAMCPVASPGVPDWLLLVDMLMYYPSINLNTNSQQNLVNNVTLPRYADGKGVMMYLNNIAGTTGGTAMNLHPTGFNYTNSYGVNGRVIPGTVALTASAIVPQILHSGVAANNFGPFIPLAGADQGVKSVQSVQFTAATGTAATATLVLCRPLAQIPITTAFVPQGRNLIFDMPCLQKIYDGAYLNFLLLAGGNTAASTPFYAELVYKWG